MWLLNTETGNIRHFHRPEDVPGGYAILLHVWGENEDSFQRVKEAEKTCEEKTRSQKPPSDSDQSSLNRLEDIDVVAQMQETIQRLVRAVSTLSARADQLESRSDPREVVTWNQSVPHPPDLARSSSP